MGIYFIFEKEGIVLEKLLIYIFLYIFNILLEDLECELKVKKLYFVFFIKKVFFLK